MTRYTTRQDAINAEIIAPIEAGEATADEYNIEAIADVMLLGYEDGYALNENVDFWEVVASHAR